MKDLVVFGDSFVEGYNNTDFTVVENPFGKIIADHYDVPFENKGKRGHGNFSISYDVFNYVRNNETSNKAFLICFSGWRRGYRLIHEGSPSYIPKQKRLPSVVGGIPSKIRYQEEVCSPFIHRHWTEMSIFSCVELCRHYNIPFLMTNSFCEFLAFEDWNWIFNKENWSYWIEGTKWNNTLYDILLGRWLNDDIISFKRKALDNRKQQEFNMLSGVKPLKNNEATKYITLCQHPTVAGHKLIAETLIPYCREIIQE